MEKMNSGLSNDETRMISELNDLEKEIRLIAPKMTAALKTYHKLRDHHASLVTKHRDLQKEYRILQDQITKLPNHINNKKSLVRDDPEKTKRMIKSLSEQDRQLLRALLLGE